MTTRTRQDELSIKEVTRLADPELMRMMSCNSSSESDSSEDEKGLLCLFSQEDSNEEMCLMAEEEEVTSQDQSSNYSSESICHENPREAFEKMLKSFYGIEDSHLKLKEENAKLLAERQDLEELRSKNAEMLESISQLERQENEESVELLQTLHYKQYNIAKAIEYQEPSAREALQQIL
nr:lisH domain-containing protein C1711.05-like [Ipomoea batatas]